VSDDRSTATDNAAELEGIGEALLGKTSLASLTDQQRMELEDRRIQGQMASAISAQTWGRSLAPVLRRAIAQYCIRNDIDPVTELYVLGGQLYPNAAYYIRKLGELRVAGIVSDFWLEHIHVDPRLELMARDEKSPPELRARAVALSAERTLKRVERNAPDDATAICVCYIQLPDGGHPIIGCKWGGGGTSVRQFKSGGGSSPNPVVEANPEMSVESQSIRRAARQVVSRNHGVDLGRPEAEVKEINDALQPALERAEAEDAAGRAAEARPPAALAAPDPTDPYGLNLRKPERAQVAPGGRQAPDPLAERFQGAREPQNGPGEPREAIRAEAAAVKSALRDPDVFDRPPVAVTGPAAKAVPGGGSSFPYGRFSGVKLDAREASGAYSIPLQSLVEAKGWVDGMLAKNLDGSQPLTHDDSITYEMLSDDLRFEIEDRQSEGDPGNDEGPG